MRAILLLTFLTVVFTLETHAAAGEVPAKVIAPFIDADTVVVVHFNLARLDFDDLMEHAETFGLFQEKDQLKMYKKWLQHQKQFTKAGGRQIFVLAGLADLAEFGRELPLLAVPLEEGADAGKVTDVLKEIVADWRTIEVAKQDRFVVAGSKARLERLKNIKAKARPEVSKALTAAGDGVLRLAFFPTPDLRRAADEMMPTLPAELGGGSSKTLTQQMRWLAVGLNIPKPGECRMVLQGADAASAQALQPTARAAVDVGLRGFMKHLAAEFTGPAPLIDSKVLDAALASFQVSVKDDHAVLSVSVKKIGSLTDAIRKSLQAGLACTEGLDNLRQIGLAFHRFHGVHGRYPGNIVDRNGKPLLSWRVAILPHLGQGALLQQIHLDEPWDSDHNKKHIAQMPSVYRRPTSRAEAAKTTYLMPVGVNTVLCIDARGLVFAKDKDNFVSRDEKNPGVRKQDITDGTANTILAVDVMDDRAVVWTKPDDWVPDPADLRKGVVGSSPGGFLAAFADGSARFISGNVGIATLRAYLTRNGGEVIDN
jgi:hypothetical protein